MPRLFLVLFALGFTIVPARAQGTREDFERADTLAELYRGKTFGERIEPHWFDNGKSLWFRVETGTNQGRFRAARVDGDVPRDLFDHAAMAKALAEAAGQPVDPDALPLESLAVADDGETYDFAAFGKRWHATAGDGGMLVVEARPVPAANPAATDNRRRDRTGGETSSPDGAWLVTLRNQNVYLRRKGEPTPGKQLSFDGAPQDAYAGRVNWSPDSEKFVVLQTRDGYDRKVTVVRSSPADGLQPELLTYDYRKAGDDIPQSRPRLFDVERGRIDLDDALWQNPWSLDDVRWRQDSTAFTVAYNGRGHLCLRIIEADADTGKTRAVVEEKRDTHIDYAGKYYCHWLGDDRLIWMSERDGWNHLYLYDVKTGEPIRQLTSGEWAVKKVFADNDSQKLLWLETYGRPGCADPLYTHYAKVDFDGNLTWLTDADGTYEKPQFSPDWSYYVATWSRVDKPPVHELRRSSDGKELMTLAEADASELYETGWKPPIRFAANGRDDKVDVHGVLFTPTNLDESKQYPVIEDVYMGLPIVPKSWRAYDGHRALAELGFVVVVDDPMVTVWPSRRHFDTGYRNLGDGGFPDRIPWIKAAAEKYPFMDLSRVGIYGTSAGGQASLRGMLAHGDFYKVCVSSCGCHDNRMDKIWWNEYWMGWPVGPWYAEQSNVTNAAKLRGPLLLIVGEVDTNVDPASTMQVVDALVKADKDFDLIVLPNSDHTSGGAYGERRRCEFFVKHLLGVEPRRDD